MQVLLIAEPGLPLTKNIAKILDSDRRITRADLDPRIKIFNIRQRLAHCAIYVDRSPSQLIINKLRDAGCPLILIAEEYYKTELFIPIDDFFTPQYLGSFCNNIVGLRSLYEMERDSFSMILPDKAIWNLNPRREMPFKGKVANQVQSTKNSQNTDLLPAGTQSCSTLPKLDLNETQLKVASSFYHGTLNGLSKKAQHQQLGFSDPYYYEVLSQLRDLFSVKTYELLSCKLREAVAEGQLNL